MQSFVLNFYPHMAQVRLFEDKEHNTNTIFFVQSSTNTCQIPVNMIVNTDERQAELCNVANHAVFFYVEAMEWRPKKLSIRGTENQANTIVTHAAKTGR